MKRSGAILLSMLLFAAGGCNIHPPAPTPTVAMCDFVRHELEVEIPSGGSGPMTGATPSFSDALAATLQPAAARPGDNDMLFLSGGSLHGAFGAGFLQGVAEANGGHLPSYRVVTGVSTGSILSTFAFLDQPERLVEGYRITSESQLLTPIIRIRDGRPTLRSIAEVMRRGAVADLAPLRARLRSEFTPSVLWQVRERHLAGRRLFVGAVDVDSGKAVAFDLGDMATRYFAPQAQPIADEAAEDPVRARIRDCYVEAVMASSSAPMAAVPVFIDNRMYVDGGARFGMFSDEIGSVIHDQIGAVRAVDQRSDVTLIVNGTLEINEECGKADPSLCPPYGGLEGAHADWNLLGLAQRSEKILVNQVYRFSAGRILERDPQNPPFFARINAAASDGHIYAMPPEAGLGSGTRTCAQWMEVDRELLHPVQFYPRYMWCLIDYGYQRGRNGQWDSRPTT